MKKVLIIDDEDSIGWILNIVLEQKHYTVLLASNGEEGIRVANAESPDLIIMDYKLPFLNGWEATRQIRTFLPEVPVIGHTAYVNELDMQDGYKAGLNEILGKPVDLDEWELTLRKYLGD